MLKLAFSWMIGLMYLYTMLSRSSGMLVFCFPISRKSFLREEKGLSKMATLIVSLLRERYLRAKLR